MKIDSYSKTIALATTPQNLIAAASGALPQFKFAKSIVIRCPSANTSDVLIGSVERQALTVLKGTSLAMSHVSKAGVSGKYALADIYVKAGTNNDTVEVLLIDPSNE